VISILYRKDRYRFGGEGFIDLFCGMRVRVYRYIIEGEGDKFIERSI